MSKKSKAKWCAPTKDKDGNDTFTCYTKDSLITIAKDLKIPYKGVSKSELWNKIDKKMSNKCKDEICWVKDKKKILNKTFRPEIPKEWLTDLTIWLDTDNINAVMKQYENQYDDFYYLGTVPLDCNINSPLKCELTKFNPLKMYNKGKTKYGVVFNQDKSWQEGSHWYCVYIDLNKDITFYDSYGSKPPTEIEKFMNKIKSIPKFNNLNIDYNKKRHQYDDYNCGMYSMYYIIKRLEGKSLKQVSNMNINTSKMQKLKTIWYRNNFV